MKDIIVVIVSICAVILFIYGAYRIAKHGSYFFFYESMVRQTITEMVKEEALR